MEVGSKVTYMLNKYSRGNATILRFCSVKRGYVYIKTETEGTLLVPLGELVPR